MEKKEYKLISEALEAQSLEKIEATIQCILLAEVNKLSSDSLTMARWDNLLSQLTIPVKMEAEKTVVPKPFIPPEWLATLSWLLGVAIVLTIGVMVNYTIAGIVAVALGCGLFFLMRRHHHVDIPVPTIRITTSAENLSSRIERVTSNLRVLLKPVTPNGEDIPTAQSHTLAGQHPSIISWLKDRYTDSCEFGPDVKDFFQRRIRQLLSSYNYKVIDYEDGNKQFFDYDYSNRISKIEQLAPAIIEQNSQRIIHRGKVLFPE